jgi:NAD(P)-dependent dehydrogenase (short-subunit alcohol dehydrogenase family)
MKLETTIPFVTGANRGIGRALVKSLVARGVKKLYAAARDPKSLDALVKAHPAIIPVQLDTTDARSIAAAAARATDISVLINNAGVLSSGSLLDSPMEAIQRDLDTNYLGTLAVTRVFAPTLVAQQGALVNLLTVVSLASMPGVGGYAASKAAAFSMTQGLRAELGKKGVRVFGVFPGPIDTDMAKEITLPKTSPEQTAEAIVAGLVAGTLDIFPDPMSQQVGAQFEKSPAAVASMFASL